VRLFVCWTEASDGWLLLFDGESLFGWVQPDNPRWHVADSNLVFEGPERKLLRSTSPFGDYDLKFDFQATDADAGPGLFLRISKDQPPGKSGYEVWLGSADEKWPAGSVVDVAKSDGTRLAANQWHSVEVNASGDQLSVSVDGRKVSEGKDAKSKAGYIAFQGHPGAGLKIRNVKLKPTNLDALFDGTGMSRWKVLPEPPAKPHKGIKKIPSMIGLGGGKPKEAKWNTVGNSIHAEGGRGELISSESYGDFLLQVQGRAQNPNKKDHGIAELILRADAVQWFAGYEAEIGGSGSGGIKLLSGPRKAMSDDGDFVLETIVANGRHFTVWVNGYPVTDVDDKRPESSSASGGPKTSPGPIGLAKLEPDSVLDFTKVSVAALPKSLGGQAGRIAEGSTPPVPPVTPPALPSATGQQSQPTSAPVAPQAQPPAQSDVVTPQTKRLLADLYRSSDPSEQMKLCDQLIQSDPSRVPSQICVDAKQRVEHGTEQHQKDERDLANEAELGKRKQHEGTQKFEEAKQAFHAKDFAKAALLLAAAERLIPGDPRLRVLRTGLDGERQARDRLRYLMGGGGLLALGGGLALFFRTRGKKYPYLEVEDGIEKGKRFGLDQAVIHIGAVPQDGGERNEVVVRDPDRMISRFHCEIHNQNGNLLLVDCNSSNGTSVDGRRLKPGQPTRLKNGSRVSLAGTCALRVGFERRKST
jgi:hypothetical protein